MARPGEEPVAEVVVVVVLVLAIMVDRILYIEGGTC